MYRFRRIENLIGTHKELENQEIYFSDMASLKDPMEGFRNFYWEGDLIVWRNFLRHYLFCLERVITLTYFIPEDQFLSENDIPVSDDEETLPTEKYRDMIHKMNDRLFSIDVIGEYLGVLSNSKKVDRDEIFMHLKLLHMIVVSTIIEIHWENGLTPNKPEFSDIYSSIGKFIKTYKTLSAEQQKFNEFAKMVFPISVDVVKELDLIQAFNEVGMPENQKKWFVLSGFPSAYLNKICNMIYPNPYVACFMNDCTNAAVWGHYGDSHKGVCLKFRTQDVDNIPAIDLNCITGFSGGPNGSKNIHGYRSFKFRKVQYQEQFGDIDFFKSIGRIPIKQLMSQWYSDSEGHISQCAQHLKNEDLQSEWRKRYWGNFECDLFIKWKDWEYENEHRLILYSSLQAFERPEDRKLKYKFEDLEAIIFGARTKTEDKIKIMKIIHSKCKENNRNDFTFYQADTQVSSGSMKLTKMNLLKFE